MDISTQDLKMDIYYVLALAIPTSLVAVFSAIAVFLVRKYNKRGFKLSAVLSTAAVTLLIFLWVTTNRQFFNLQCKRAYGEASADVKMCDNPANGIAMITQFPMLMMVAVLIATVIFLKLKPLKHKQ